MTSLVKSQTTKSLVNSTHYENHQLHQEAQIVNPESLTLQVANHLDSSFSYDLVIEQIKSDLLNNTLNTRTYIRSNHEYLETIQNIYNKLPKMVEVTRQKLVIPEFEEIEVLKSDNAEIKKFIRKVNYEMLGFHCNHNSFDKKYEVVIKKITDLYESKDYKQYESFIKTLCSCVWQIRDKDSRGKKWVSEILPCSLDVKNAMDSIIKINGQVALINSDANPVCSKCKASVRKYEYSLREIQRMREELKEQNVIDKEYIEKPAETKYDMKTFMNKNYPTIDRFELADVKEKYKKTFNVSLTIAELKTKIEETNMFKVTNSKNRYYVNRL